MAGTRRAGILGAVFAASWGLFGAAAQDESGEQKPEQLPFEAFLGAGRIGDLGLDQRELEPYFVSLLDKAWEVDPDLIGPLALQTDALVIHEQVKESGWYRPMWNGWSVLAEIMSRYKRSQPGLIGIGTYTRLHRDDEEGRFPTGGGFVSRNNRALLRAFLAAGGNYEPEMAMDRLSGILRHYCGEGDMVYLVPTFALLGDYLRPDQRRSVREWAEAVSSGNRSGDREIARRVELGRRLHLRHEFPPGHPSGLTEAECEEVDAALIEILEDDTVSHAWRQGFAAYLSAVMPERIGPELGQAIGRTCASTLRNDIPFSSIGLARCVWAFRRCRVEPEEPAWDEVADEFLAGWKHRNRYNHRPKDQGLALDPSRLTVLATMEVACVRGDRTAIDWQMENFTNTYGAFPGMFVSLVSEGFHDRAYTLLRERGEEVRYRSDHYLVGPRFDDRLHEATPDFLEQVPDRAWREYAALLLAATPDPDPVFEVDTSLPRRPERIAEAAGEWSRQQAAAKGLELVADDLLSTIRGSDATVAVLDKAPELFFERLEEFDSIGSTELYWLAHQHFHGAMVRLVEGEPFAAQFLWGRFVFEERDEDDPIRRHATEAVVDKTLLWLWEFLATDRREEIDALLPFARQVIGSVPTRVYRNDVSDLQNTVLIAHALLDEMAAYRDWWDSLSKERKEFLSGLLHDEMGLIGETGRRLNGWGLPAEVRFPDDVDRRRLYLDLLTSPLVDAGYTRNELLGYGISRQLIIEEDLGVVAETVGRQAPREGVALREWFGFVAETESLSQSRQLAEEELANAPSEVLRVAIQIEQALQARAAGEREEAERILRKIEEREFEWPAEMALYFRDVERSFEGSPSRETGEPDPEPAKEP